MSRKSRLKRVAKSRKKKRRNGSSYVFSGGTYQYGVTHGIHGGKPEALAERESNKGLFFPKENGSATSAPQKHAQTNAMKQRGS